MLYFIANFKHFLPQQAMYNEYLSKNLENRVIFLPATICLQVAVGPAPAGRSHDDDFTFPFRWTARRTA